SEALVTALAGQQPALVVTTSHGMTGPLDDLETMRQQLGALVDQDHAVLDVQALVQAWEPRGAIWFAQACCSVGADRPSTYDGLFAADTDVGRVLSAVAELGAMTSPLPRALLGAPHPLRAFIGQVEPTFNWTMAFPPNQQRLTADIELALYDGLCGGAPAGLAMSRYYQPVGTLLQQHDNAVKRYNVTAGAEAQSSLDTALYTKVTAYDRASTVILGDPVVAMRLPADDVRG
ncbi:MAG: hypothetical protein ACRDQF_20720, partial [Thermocrispum sp.]